MADFSRAVPGGGWRVGDDTETYSRAVPGGQWEVQQGSAAPPAEELMGQACL